jgi:hypothetical protein
MHESGYAAIVNVSDWNTLGRIVVPPRISHFADNGQRLYGTNAGCVYELQMLKDVAPSIAASDPRCIRSLPPEIAWAVASGIDMLMTSPFFGSGVQDDSQFVASLQEVQRCVERLQSLAAFVCSLQAAQGTACADHLAVYTDIERAVHTAAHDRLIQLLRRRHSREDLQIAEAASFFLSMDPVDMGVAPHHAAAVRDAVAFSMHRKHRSLNRRRSSIDALSMLSRVENTSPVFVQAEQDDSFPADTDQESCAAVVDERDVNVSSDGIHSATAKKSPRAVLTADVSLPQETAESKQQQLQPAEQPLQLQSDCSQNHEVALNQQTVLNQGSSVFLPLDVLSIDSSCSGRSSVHEEDHHPSDTAAIEESAEVLTITSSNCKMSSKVGAQRSGGIDRRRGSVEFDAESVLSHGGGARVSFIDLSESAQVSSSYF